ncbi:MAG: hypothetical protein JSW20_02130, partial [Nitrospiraceae bacterium]
MKHLVSIMLVAFLVFLFIVSISAEVFADGDEGLGTPSINIASGTGYIASGTGLEDAQPSALSINITDNFNQVLLYWSGNNVFPNPGDDTIIIDGTEVKGTLIGTSDTWPSGDYILVYRADITNLGLVRGGA